MIIEETLIKIELQCLLIEIHDYYLKKISNNQNSLKDVRIKNLNGGKII